MNNYIGLAVLNKAKFFLKEQNKNKNIHRDIVDYYNQQVEPLAERRYRLSIKDSWCAAFISVCMHYSTINKGFECGADRLRHLHEKINIDNVHKGDLIFYDWDNNGWSDHVGIISNVQDNLLEVIEGNKNNKVGIRIVSKNSKSIIQFARIKL